MRRLLVVIVGCLFLLGCGSEPSTGPTEVKWDRDVCQRCDMILSDRNHAAQVRHLFADGTSNVYLFDDLGCAVLWLEGQIDADIESSEIWVADHRTGDWIDAKTAHYVAGQVTPMGYGLGGQSDPAQGALTFARAKANILVTEQQVNVHAGHLKHYAVKPQTTPKDGEASR